MKNTLAFTALTWAVASASAQTVVQPQWQGQVQDMGRVISSTPVVQQVAVPRQVCSQQQVAIPQQKSGGGAAIGALAGGAIGNAIGQGGGNAAATILGIVGGAILGNSIEGERGNQVQNQQVCNTQTFYENRAVAYTVVYEFGGRQYTTQMAQDPGPYVRLQITPVGAVSAPPVGVQPQAVYINPPTYVQTIVSEPTYIVSEPAIMVQPAYRPYYPPLGISLNLGYVRHGGAYHNHGYHHGHRGHHWR